MVSTEDGMQRGSLMDPGVRCTTIIPSELHPVTQPLGSPRVPRREGAHEVGEVYNLDPPGSWRES